MELRKFEHATASSLPQAATLAESHAGKTVFVAGGTDLLGALKDNIYPTYPELLVDLKAIPGLGHIEEQKGALCIGALTTLADIAAHPAIRTTYPVLAEAAQAVASPQLRNMGTLGGNLCQEPRCWYYRFPENRFHCLRKGGERCDALFGENRYHSVFGAAWVGAPSCSSGCPAHVDIPAYLAQIREGDLNGAAALVLESNPMPAITGRVCPHYCEQACNHVEHGGAVSIRAIERRLGDHALEHAEELYRPPKRQTRQHVAVVGAGPAGLSAAYFLRQRGHRVTVFDAMEEPGGMLAFGIPAYRLPAEIVRRQMAAFQGMGIELKTGTAIGGSGPSLGALRKQFDGVVLATGAWGQKRLGLKKEEWLDSGLDFLRGIRQGTVRTVAPRVLVVGGGNVAVDVAISALRLGAAEVTMVCLERQDEMPAFPDDIEQAILEKVRILPSWGPREILGSKGALRGMKLVRCTSVFDADGRFAPTFDEAQTAVVEAEQIITAIGQSGEVGYAGKRLRTERGLVVVDETTGATNLAHVFAVGDAVSGPATVVAAIAAGRQTALAMDLHLGVAGRRKSAAAPRGLTTTKLLSFDRSALATSERESAHQLTVGRRTIDGEDRSTLDMAAVETEARRCVNCGCVAVNASDLAPALIALGASIETTHRTLAAQELFIARQQATTVLLPGELIKKIRIPRPAASTRQVFQKFRTRASIDFPVVSVAVVVTLDGDLVSSARIVLGAVAPVPVRAELAEQHLRGKRLDAALATEAGDLAVSTSTPLAENRYKVQITRALVKRALTTLVPVQPHDEG